MNIVVFPSPYKQKMPSTGPFAVVFLRRSLIYYFLQETEREVPNYFASSAKACYSTNASDWPYPDGNHGFKTSNAQHPTSGNLPAEGLEPTRPCGHWILSPARLPIPPRRRFGKERDDTTSAHKLKRAEHVETLTG